MLIKARFRCEKCPAHIDLGLDASVFGEYLTALRRSGWKVAADKFGTRHYCPACEVEEF